MLMNMWVPIPAQMLTTRVERCRIELCHVLTYTTTTFQRFVLCTTICFCFNANQTKSILFHGVFPEFSACCFQFLLSSHHFCSLIAWPSRTPQNSYQQSSESRSPSLWIIHNKYRIIELMYRVGVDSIGFCKSCFYSALKSSALMLHLLPLKMLG